VKSFVKLIGRLPFAGKIPIRPFVFGLYQSTTTAKRRRSYLWLMALLVLLVVAYGAGARMGVRALSFDSPTWAKAISVAYVVVNACIILTQIYLGFRATRFCLRASYPRVKRSNTGYSYAEIAVMFVVTSTGQFMFFLLYFLYN